MTRLQYPLTVNDGLSAISHRLMTPYKQLKLERVGPATAQAGVVSVPLPADIADLAIDHPGAGAHVLACREADDSARRVLVCIADKGGVPDELGVNRASGQPMKRTRAPWNISTPITREKLDFASQIWRKPDHIRGTPVQDCAAVESALELKYGRETIRITAGATGPAGAASPWQNVQLERLWSNDAAEAVRVGGIIYNGDTFLCAHIYLVLYATGVAEASCHFVNTKLHVRCYDFRGIPFIRFEGKQFGRRNLTLPKAGFEHRLGALSLNLQASAALCSDEYPGRLQIRDTKADWYPFHRVFNPQKTNAPGDYWDLGMARTVRFNFSLSAAPPIVARYRVPSWWYGACGEAWGTDILPVDGRYAPLSHIAIDSMLGDVVQGRFDAGRTVVTLNDGHTGTSMMLHAYQSGRADVYDAAMAYIWYWADIAVDHNDFTVHQWVGGWQWKTCAYSKFRDLVYGYLETGDPYFEDTVENVADVYWMWFRTNWPRSSIGRDMFPTGDWALMRRYLDSDRARKRTRQLVAMVSDVVADRGSPGGQMGGGAHPGYVDALYMIGVCMTVCLDIAEAEQEAGNADEVAALLPMVKQLHGFFIRDDVMLFPSHPTCFRADWSPAFQSMWTMEAARIYPALSRFWPTATRQQQQGLDKLAMYPESLFGGWAIYKRNCLFPLQSISHDAYILGARVDGTAVVIEPCGKPANWPEVQTAHTPWGRLEIRASKVRGVVEFVFSAERKFPVRVCYNGKSKKTHSKGTCRV
jgi:hypothetical protein